MVSAAPIGMEIVERIAASEGLDPIDLDTPLYDVIDPDALEALLNSSDRMAQTALRVEFTYYGYDVSVDGTGDITISKNVVDADTDEKALEGAVSD